MNDRAMAVVSRQEVLALHHEAPWEKAQEGYWRYLSAHPDDAGMWANQAVLLRRQRRWAAAIGCCRRALALKPDDAGILTNLGNIYKDCDRLEEAVACQRQAVALAPDNALVRLNLAVALREARLFEEAKAQLDALLEREPGKAAYRWERAIVNLYLGEFRQGWEDYEARWQTGELPVVDFGCPRWHGEDLQGKRLLLVAEQGYGDTILAARFVAVIQQRYPECHISLLCKPELHRLFASLGVALVQDAKGHPHDVYCPLMSLMGVLGIDDTNVPPPVALQVPEAARKKFAWLAKHAPGKRKIGIVWSGSLTFKDNAKRSANLEQFLSLAENPALQLYSFQKGPRQKDLYEQGAVPLVVDLANQLEDFADTAAAVQHMDMVVMTDSSLAHLAASLGRPVLNLLQFKPYWLYATDARLQAWYPAMRAMRQQKPGEWDGIFVRAQAMLRVLCDQNRRGMHE